MIAISKAILASIIVIVVILVAIGVILTPKHAQQSQGSSTTVPSYSSTIVIVVGSGGNSSTQISSSATTTTIPNNSSANQSNQTIQPNFTNFIYCVGSATQFSNETFFAPINSSGIGQWNQTTNYPIPMFVDGCSINNGYIYCVGSPGLSQPSNQSNKFSYYTQVSPLGLNQWVQTTSYPISLIDGGCSTSNNYIYCVGGGNYSDPKAAYYAPLSAAGIGEWKNTTPYPIGLFDAGCTIYYTYIYCIGTEYVNTSSNSINFATLGSVYYAPISNLGIGNWSQTTSYPIPIFGAGCSTFNDVIYCVGDAYPNATLSKRTYYSQILPSGELGKWTQSTNYPIPLSYAGCVTSYGYIYCVGTYNSTYSQNSYYAPVSENGIGTWNQTTNYPIPLFDAYCSTNFDSGGFYSS